jgi:hypothetical protein
VCPILQATTPDTHGRSSPCWPGAAVVRCAVCGVCRFFSGATVHAFAACCFADSRTQHAQWTQPFFRVLNITNPPMSGSDVVIAQNLLQRSPSSNWNVSKNGVYSADTAKAVGLFQKSHKMYAT